MADQRITDLTAITGANVATGDLTVVVDTSDTSMAATGTDKRLTVGELGIALVALGAVVPSGAAGGDLSGTYPNPTVTDDSHAHTTTTLPATIVYDGDTAGGDLSGTFPNPVVESAPVGFTVGSPVVGAGYGINSTGGIATEAAFAGLLFYGTQWAGAATIDLRRINGSKVSPSAVLSGDVIGGMHIGAAIEANNTTLDDVAQFYSVATENYSATATGNRWDFYVSKNSAGVAASTSKAVAFRIDQDGSIYGGFGTYGAVTSATWSVSNTGAVTAASSTIGAVTITSAGAVSGVTTLAMTGQLTQTRNAALPAVMLIRDNTIATVANTNVGQISFQGTQDTSHNFVSAAVIAAVSEAGYSGPTNAPTQLRFGTTSAAASLVNRIILDASGSLHLAPSVSSGLVTTATFAIKSDGSVWVAPSAYSSNQPSAAAATISAAGDGTFAQVFSGGTVQVYTTANGGTKTSNYDLVSIAVGTTFTSNSASITGTGIDMVPVISYSTAPGGAFGWRGFQDGSTHQNTSGSGAVMTGVYVSFEGAPTLKTQSANANTITSYSAFRGQPVLAGTASGILTITTLSVFNSAAVTVPANVTVSTMNQMQVLGPTVSASGTLTTRRGIQITDASNSGTLTTNIGIDIAALAAGGTTNLGIRTFADVLVSAANIQTDTTTGMQIGTQTTQKLGFYGATPIIKGTAFTQTYSTASHTHAAVTASTPPAGGTGATAGAYDTAANRNLMITSLTNNIADVANVKQVLNGLIDDLQALGLIA